MGGKRLSEESAIILFSGGQDSTTCLFWALQRFKSVRTMSIYYGQKHELELDAARKVSELAGVEHEVLYIGKLLGGTSPLVSDEPLGQYNTIDELPSGVEPTFVPGRNILFLVLSANRAVCEDTTHIVTGVCEEDYGGYPDCRRSFIDAMEKALSLGMFGEESSIKIHTPLMSLTKKETVELAQELPGCMEALSYTHTCYNGTYPPCERCHACHIRARGFNEAGIVDPIYERAP